MQSKTQQKSDSLKCRVQMELGRYSWWRFALLPLYPITLLFTTPVMLCRTIWSSRVLLNGRWGRYPHFNVSFGIESLFYWGQAHLLYTHGRNGRARSIGLGDYPLSRWFNLSLPSLYSFRGAGAVSVLLGMLGWLCMHLVWMPSSGMGWGLLVCAVTLISTTFYAQTFGTQNYNAVGWLFFPLGVYGLTTGNIWMASAVWLLCSFGSFTATAFAILFTAVHAATTGSLIPLIALLPVSIKLITQFLPTFRDQSLLVTLSNVAKAIGLKSKAKYLRKKRTRVRLLSSAATFFYHLVIYGQFAIVCYLFELPVYLLVTAIVLYILRGTILHFGDVENANLAILSVALPLVLQSGEPLVLGSFWILAAPLPLMATFDSPKPFDLVPHCAPFDIEPLLTRMKEFLRPVSQGDRVLFAFENPENCYDRLFDGFRRIMEAPFYVCVRKGAHFFPYWWDVFETNYEGAPEFWGRSPQQVTRNMRQWECKYVIVYQDKDQPSLDPQWAQHGFEEVGSFRWSTVPVVNTSGVSLPNWWLLKRKA